MFDVSDDAKGGFRRVEVLTGPGRRRRWSADVKARIVAETLLPGARVSEVARRWQICSQQVFGWRRATRQGLPSVPKTTTPPGLRHRLSSVTSARSDARRRRRIDIGKEQRRSAPAWHPAHPRPCGRDGGATAAALSFVPIVSEAIPATMVQRLPRRGSRSSLPVRWCGSHAAWMMLLN
jgi:transposase-like protein